MSAEPRKEFVDPSLTCGERTFAVAVDKKSRKRFRSFQGMTEADGESRRVVKVGTVHKFKRSESGSAIMPPDWDDSEDVVYDNA